MKAYCVYKGVMENGTGTSANVFNMTVNNAGRAAATAANVIAAGSSMFTW